MKEFMRKFEHPIKEVALFISGVVTGAGLASLKDNEKVLTDEEKEKFFIKKNNPEIVNDNNKIKQNENMNNEEVLKYLHPGDDETIKEAIEIALQEKVKNLSHLQRRLHVGYNRAEEIFHILKERGVIECIE